MEIPEYSLMESRINELIAGKPAEEVIPVFAAYIAAMGIFAEIEAKELVGLVTNIILNTYRLNKAPPINEMN
jgi:hypothetical protein